MCKKYLKINDYILCLTKSVWQGFSFFLIGLLLLGLLSCSNTTDDRVFVDVISPAVISITNKDDSPIIVGKTGSLSFIFNKKVTSFYTNDIQLPNNIVIGKFTTNSNLKEYFLEIIPPGVASIEIHIPKLSLEDLSGYQNPKSYSTKINVFVDISFKLNGGAYSDSSISNIIVPYLKTIDKARLEGILFYPPTGPQPDIEAVTRNLAEWKNYDFSTAINNNLTIEAIWSNSCGKKETFHPKSKTELKNHVDNASPTDNLNYIDTSAITDMSGLFKGKNFKGEISCWNTSKANNMGSMFQDATAFNGNISNWNVSSVTNMSSMFQGATAFNGNISNWNVSSVNNMSGMFSNATAFNRNIRNWNVSSVTNMSGMFKNATAFNQDLSGWPVGAVTSHNDIFTGSGMASETSKQPNKFR